eukprot:SAG22_NODE_87_length_21437_cov_14.162480_2_plen_49_part_00
MDLRDQFCPDNLVCPDKIGLVWSGQTKLVWLENTGGLVVGIWGVLDHF